MKAGKSLNAWLMSQHAQAEAASGMEDFAREFRQLPALVALGREVDTGEAAGVEAILAAARRFLQRDQDIESCVEMMIAAAAGDSFFRPTLRLATSEVHSGLLVFDRPCLSIQVAIMPVDALAAKRTYRTGRASIAFTGQWMIYRFLKAGGATLSFWEAPEIRAGFSAEASGTCRLVERRQIRDGETIEIDGSKSSFLVDHAFTDLVYVQAATPLGAAPLMAEYDSETLAFAGASSTDDASSRTQMMLALLRIMDRTDAASVFRDMLQSEHFYARWQTMREFLALDAERALPHLRDMAADDPHPEVRAAAAQTLAAFFPPETVSAEEHRQPCRV